MIIEENAPKSDVDLMANLQYVRFSSDIGKVKVVNSFVGYSVHLRSFLEQKTS